MNYSQYKTNDDSLTLFNHARQEHYHSYDGAYQEAQIKYYDACKITKKANDNDIVKVFEVGFGLGYNLLPILKNLKSLNTKIVYLSTESDRALFSYLLANIDALIPKHYQDIYKEIFKHNFYEDDFIKVKIYNGDVRNSIQMLESSSVDAVFHDPFSPYKNTECWSYDFFKEEFRIMKEDAILSTYSMSTPVRSGMYQAGFTIWEGVGDKTKTTGTIASKMMIPGLNELSEKMIRKLHESPDRIPFRDSELKESHLKIKSDRLAKKKNEDYSDIKR